ncbi:MAG: HPr family phosphocarrier protein [Brevinema sp.]
MISREIKILNRYGIHARPSSMISELAMTFKSSIIIKKEDRSAQATSVMDLILLCVEPGSTIFIYIDGEDEAQAMHALVDLIEIRQFDEENMQDEPKN